MKCQYMTCVLLVHPLYTLIGGEPHDGSVDEVVDALHIGVTATFILLGSLGILFAVACLLLNFILREKL